MTRRSCCLDYVNSGSSYNDDGTLPIQNKSNTRRELEPHTCEIVWHEPAASRDSSFPTVDETAGFKKHDSFKDRKEDSARASVWLRPQLKTVERLKVSTSCLQAVIKMHHSGYLVVWVCDLYDFYTDDVTVTRYKAILLIWKLSSRGVEAGSIVPNMKMSCFISGTMSTVRDHLFKWTQARFLDLCLVTKL